MVLESVVADLLNRFLGDYVQNLDRSQLKLGIWGGSVALDNLQIRENSLSELDVPFKVKFGQIDKLNLKIPWKNLYGEAVVATLEGLYLLVVPGSSIKYDAVKEERLLQESKQRELLRIEEALQKVSDKGPDKGFVSLCKVMRSVLQTGAAMASKFGVASSSSLSAVATMGKWSG